MNLKYFFEDKLAPFATKKTLLGIALFLVIGGSFASYQIWFRKPTGEVQGQNMMTTVDAPTIIDGELVLPKLYRGTGTSSEAKIRVDSAFLVGVYEEQQQQQSTLGGFGGAQNQEPPKLIGIRILGEVTNLSNQAIKEVSPVVRFYDEKDKMIAQKVANISPEFVFYGFGPGEVAFYDILVPEPIKADKLEILMNAAKFGKTSDFEKLKINKVAMEVKTAKPQQNNETAKTTVSTESGETAPSAVPTPSPQPSKEVSEVEYYTVTGSFENNLSDPVSDATIYVWVKNTEGKAFSFGKLEFKGDLISPKKRTDFKINLFPFKYDEKMDKYEVVVFAKRYKLN